MIKMSDVNIPTLDNTVCMTTPTLKKGKDGDRLADTRRADIDALTGTADEEKSGTVHHSNNNGAAANEFAGALVYVREEELQVWLGLDAGWGVGERDHHTACISLLLCTKPVGKQIITLRRAACKEPRAGGCRKPVKYIFPCCAVITRN